MAIKKEVKYKRSFIPVTAHRRLALRAYTALAVLLIRDLQEWASSRMILNQLTNMGERQEENGIRGTNSLSKTGDL